ncbi:Transcriptional regulator, AcrR family [Pseudomonas sp. R1-43-08]|uniref:TetR/AcrR family transcriptional regulator n=1 Tax=Pseudomonas sp. R1-43-08 TaxID=1173270 RepID=UPI000F57E23C|nr:TetR/AcrR family transcriptional regulator [Pseudomonas sp. R1-43-08]AZF43386.1 Transcriptional regulator, AcrR family [Pseudomonas sp. R1-43-08]
MSITTKAALLHAAETHMRSKGYSAFSYADLAAQIGIRKASIHHHFPTKESLGAKLIEDYVQRFEETLKAIEAMHADPLLRLRGFSRLFVISANDGLLPLCGALAAEMAALPLSLQALTRRFFESQLHWLQSTLCDAVEKHRWVLDKPVDVYAFMLLGALEGASLINWALGRSNDSLSGFNHLLETLATRSSLICAG